METEDTQDPVTLGMRPDWSQRKASLTALDKSEIVDACTSFSLGEYRMLERYKLTVGELEDLLLDFDVERCPSCRLHTDSHALFDLNGVLDGNCSNCRNYK